MSTRTITGICATPTVDSHNQRAMTHAYRWTLPLPLLVAHRGPRVGTVTRLWREGAAIHFAAEVSDDGVWRQIKSGDLRCASISLKDTRSEEDDDGALLVKEGELAEVSVCVEGANPDCVISIPSTARYIRRSDPVKPTAPTTTSSGAEPRYPGGARKAGDAAALAAARQAFTDFHTSNFGVKGLNRKAVATIGMIFEIVGQMIAAEAWASARMAEAEERIAALEGGGQLAFRGVYQRAASYTRNALVTHDGALWVALSDVPEGVKPGTSDVWQLAVKTGGAR